MITHPLSLPLPHRPGWGERWPEQLLSAAFGRSAGVPAPRAGAAANEGGDECRAVMRQVLDDQIIPRLLRVSRAGHEAASPARAAGPGAGEVEAFARVCASGDRAAGSLFIDRLRAGGLQPDSVLEDLVAPAARWLGQQWEDDRMDFASVTVGLVMMHALIHAVGYESHDGPQVSGAVRRVMLASAPGSQHVLGLSIVSEFFRKAGWQVVLEVSPSAHELGRAVANEWFDLLGLSVGLDTQLAALPGLVAKLRQASRNPLAPVLLGGPVFFQRDLSAASFGAQAICLDARSSVQLAAQLVTR